MNRVVFLDAGPLGLVTNPRRSDSSAACERWLQSLLIDGIRIVVPAIADYEVRRELLRANKVKGIERLDALVEYLPISTAAIRQAAAFWAQARQQGRPTAGDKTIDADVILAAQAATFGDSNVVIATTNVGHLSRFAPAALWIDIGRQPPRSSERREQRRLSDDRLLSVRPHAHVREFRTDQFLHRV